MSEKKLEEENDREMATGIKAVLEDEGFEVEFAHETGGTLVVSEGAIDRLVEFFERMDKKTGAELGSIKKDVF